MKYHGIRLNYQVEVKYKALMVNGKKIAIFSFFSGIGILDLGFEKTGYDVVYANEIIPAFLTGYKHSRESMGITAPRYGYDQGDINDLLGKNSKLSPLRKKATSEFDLVGFIGGPPCPDFSVGGKNRGKDGENGKLSLSYINLIIQEKPDFFLFENVKGLWSTKRHREFYDSLKKKLEKEGYVLFDQLVNALSSGAPQDRNRILLVGFKKSLVKEGMEFPWNKVFTKTRSEIREMGWPETNKFLNPNGKEKPKNILEELTVEYWFKKNNVEKHPNAKDYFKPRSGLARMETIEEGDVSRKSYKRLHRWRYSPTVCYGNNEVHLHPYKARRLSVAEALALQSAPKEFQLPSDMTLSYKFKSIGNAVPYLLAEGIAKTIKMTFNYLNEGNGIRHSKSDRSASQRAGLLLHKQEK